MTEPQKPAYSPGLEGVIAGESAICSVDVERGLLYRGYDADELAREATFEEVAWLLLHGELPTAAQLAEFRRVLTAERPLPAAVLDMLRSLPRGTHPMDALRTGVSMLGTFDADAPDNSHDANVRKATRLVAKLPALVTSASRIAQGKDLVTADASLSHAGNFVLTLTGRRPEPWLARMMDTIFILYAEHEFNASTFSARVTASTLADMYAAVTSACGTLKGPLHGGANEEAMKMLREVGSPERAEGWLKERLARKDKIMGFGHRVYKKGDSRVPVMREICRQLGERVGQPQWTPICEKLEEVMAREKNLYSNLDLYAAPVFYMMGIAAELNTPIFAVARVAGWCAHVIEQHDHNRLIRPRSLYTGPARRSYPQ